MTETYSFGEWIAQRRKTLDLSQRELAAQTNCALVTIKKIESDERRPSRELAELLVDALKIPGDWRETFVACARGLRAVDALEVLRSDGSRASVPHISQPLINLPAQSTPFIGREDELAQLEQYLADPACRLLTLVGPGGIGKTRLAYEVAFRSKLNTISGVYSVPLVGVNSPDYLVPTMIQSLKLSFQSGHDLKGDLFNYLRQKNLLLVMDNFEHLLDGAGLLSELLAAAPLVKIVVTSRERLNLSSEWLYPVGGLSFPQNEEVDDAMSYHAVQLFDSSARRAQPAYQLDRSLSAVTHICRLTEGMPLAIELAASWVRRMSPEQIAGQIQRDLNFLSAGWRDVPERHRSLRALFDHSWRLLSMDEQDVLMKLSVFRGGFDAEVAQDITGASLYILSSLEDKSLIRSDRSSRYDLHELIRQFADSKLVDAGIKTDVQNRHLDYYMKWAEIADEQLHKAEQVAWARRIKNEYNNLRTALAWAFDSGDSQKGLRLANALWYYWFRGDGNWAEGFKWMEFGLNQTEGITRIRADGYAHAGNLAAQIGNFRTAIEYMQRGFEYSQELGLLYGIARNIMGMSYHVQDYAVVSAKFEEAIPLLRQSGSRYELATALFLYGDRARVQGDLERAQALYDESLTLTKSDQDLMLLAAVLGRQGRLAALQGDYQKAQRFYRESGELALQMDNRVALVEHDIHFGILRIYLGDYEAAERSLKDSLILSEELNSTGGKIHASYFLAELALHREEFSAAASLLVDSLQMTLSDPEWQSNFTNHEFNAERLIIAGKLACASGDYAQAACLLGAGEAVRAQSGYLLDPLPRTEYENAVSQTRSHLGEIAFAADWQAGQILSEEKALLRAMAYLKDVLATGHLTS